MPFCSGTHWPDSEGFTMRFRESIHSLSTRPLLSIFPLLSLDFARSNPLRYRPLGPAKIVDDRPRILRFARSRHCARGFHQHSPADSPSRCRWPVSFLYSTCLPLQARVSRRYRDWHALTGTTMTSNTTKTSSRSRFGSSGFRTCRI